MMMDTMPIVCTDVEVTTLSHASSPCSPASTGAPPADVIFAGDVMPAWRLGGARSVQRDRL